MKLLAEAAADDARPTINLTPLVDVALVLVIIFLATATLATPSALHLARDGAESSVPLEPVTVELAPDGGGTVAGRKIAASNLGEAIRKAVSARPETSVRVLVSRGVAHERSVFAIDAARRAGAGAISLELRGERK